MSVKLLSKIAQRAASSLVTVQASYDLACVAIQRGIPGDFVECGVYHGAQCAAMAVAVMDCYRNRAAQAPRRKVHLFDSFTGVPAAGQNDQQWAQAGHPVGQSAASKEAVVANMAEWGIDPSILIYHPGMFEVTVPAAVFSAELGSNTQIAILRLDGDLYSSTRVCIEMLYPIVSVGGWIICDDFGLDGARKAVVDYMDNGPGFPPVYWRKPC